MDAIILLVIGFIVTQIFKNINKAGQKKPGQAPQKTAQPGRAAQPQRKAATGRFQLPFDLNSLMEQVQSMGSEGAPEALESRLSEPMESRLLEPETQNYDMHYEENYISSEGDAPKPLTNAHATRAHRHAGGAGVTEKLRGAASMKKSAGQHADTQTVRRNTGVRIRPSAKNMRQAVVMAEILGAPKSRRGKAGPYVG